MLEGVENFNEVKEKGESYYKTLVEIYCPYFKDKVHFSAEGLEHLKFKRRNVARPRQDQYMRFKLLRVIPQVLGESRTLQGLHETKEFEKVRKNSRTEYHLKNITYYEFICVVEHVRVKIIVRKPENGPLIFWSIIPYWGTDTTTSKRKLHSGDLPEE